MTKTSNRCQNILEQDRWCRKQNLDPRPPALSKALCMGPIILFPVPVDKAEKQPGRQWANTTSVTQTAHTQGSPWHRPKENCRFGRSGDKEGAGGLSSLAPLAPPCNPGRFLEEKVWTGSLPGWRVLFVSTGLRGCCLPAVPLCWGGAPLWVPLFPSSLPGLVPFIGFRFVGGGYFDGQLWDSADRLDLAGV